MNPNVLFAALPDLSARIMRHTLSKELNVNWETFCRDNCVRPVELDKGTSELLAQDELLLQQGFAALTTNHPNLWVEMGLRYRSIKYGALGLAMMTSRTLGESLEIACQYQALTYSLIEYRYTSTSNRACALIGSTSGLPATLHDFTQHRDLGAVRTLIADLMAGEPVLERITVAARPPCNWETLKGYFPCPVEFDADQTRWIFLPGATDRPLPLGDQDCQKLYSLRCDMLLSQARADAPIKNRLANLLITKGESVMSAIEAAKQLAVSERTLHRRLAEEGTHFSTIIDEARYRRACELLADRRMTIETVAFAVGFAEPSSFSRAFKRWSGVNALEFRRQIER